METRKLGRQGLEVAALGLGCMGMSALLQDRGRRGRVRGHPARGGRRRGDPVRHGRGLRAVQQRGAARPGPRRRPARPGRAGHQVRLRPEPGDRQRLGAGQPSGAHPGGRRAVPAPAPDRPDRPAVPAPGGPEGADRGRRRHHGGAGPGRQGPLPGAVGGQRHDPAASPRRAPDQRPAVRIFPFRTRG